MSWDEAAEKTLLGAVLSDNAAWPSASVLEPGDFYAPGHRAIFAAIRALLDRGAAAELVSVKGALGPRLESAGGAVYLASLLDGLPRIANVGHWVGIIREHAARRRLALFGARLAEAAERGEPSADLIDKAMGHLVQLSRRANPEGFLDNRKLAKEALAEIEAQADAPHGILGLRTGLIDLDKKLQGIRPGQFGLICARLKNGKSILCLQIAENVARDTGGRVAVFSREMSGKALTKRRLSGEADVAISTLHEASREALERRMGRLAKAFERVSEPSVAINTSADTAPAIRALCQQLRAEHGLAMVVVDYLQLLRVTEKHDRRHEQIREITMELKRLAMDLEVPVLAAVQLNRGPEARADKRPYISDAADGDHIGRDCDWAVLIHREPPPSKGEAPGSTKGLADLIIDANRDGYTGTVRVRFNAHVQRFETLVVEGEWSAKASAVSA